MKDYFQNLSLLVIAAFYFLGFQLAMAAASPNHSVDHKALSLRYIDSMHRHVTFLGLGALEIGRDWGIGLANERAHATPEVAKQTLSTALRYGITIIDTATSYHVSEEMIGHFSPLNNKKHIVVTKVGESSVLASDKECKKLSSEKKFCSQPSSRYDFSGDAIRRDVAESMHRLKTDVLDVVLIHFNEDSQAIKEILDKGEAVAVLKELQEAGKIRHIGVSIDNPELAKSCINMGDFDVIEVEYNLLNQTNKDVISLAKQKGMLVITRGTLGTGLLTAQVSPYLNDPNLPFADQVKALLKLVHNDYDKLTALALAFAYENKDISSALVGAGRPEMLEKDIQLLDHFHDDKLLQQAKKLMKKFKPDSFTVDVDGYFVKKIQSN